MVVHNDQHLQPRLHGAFSAGFHCFQGAIGATSPVLLLRPNCAKDRPDSGLSVVELGPQSRSSCRRERPPVEAHGRAQDALKAPRNA